MANPDVFYESINVHHRVQQTFSGREVEVTLRAAYQAEGHLFRRSDIYEQGFKLATIDMLIERQTVRGGLYRFSTEDSGFWDDAVVCPDGPNGYMTKVR